jgi:cytidine deaminase
MAMPVQCRDAIARLPMTISATTLSELKRLARDTARRAHAPYSSFAVGAAVLGDSGRIHVGANVENASYGLSICAERSAIFRAIAEGERAIRAVCVYTPTAAASTPCGACRQVIHEFGPDALIVCCADDDAAERRYALSELLPEAFRLRK